MKHLMTNILNVMMANDRGAAIDALTTAVGLPIHMLQCGGAPILRYNSMLRHLT